MLVGLVDFKKAIDRCIIGSAKVDTYSIPSGVKLTISFRIPPAYQWENGISKEFYVFAFYHIIINFDGTYSIGKLKESPIPVQYPGLPGSVLQKAVEELLCKSEKYQLSFEKELSSHPLIGGVTLVDCNIQI